MIDKTQIVSVVLTRLKNLPIGNYLDLRTYKRDRSVIIVKKADDLFYFEENGFSQDQFEVDLSQVKKVLKGLLKKEFPRSNKIRLYTLDSFVFGETHEVSRKVI